MRLTRLFAATFLIVGGCSAVLADDAVIPPAPEENDIVVERGASMAITPLQRVHWFATQTFGLTSLIGPIPGAALSTLTNQPKEAGPHWSGFAERYEVSLSTNGVSNAMEAGLGTIWGEDPRYRRAGGAGPVKSRIGHILQWTVMAPDRTGEMRPAYARFISFTSASYATNAWREPSDTDASHSLGRIAFALLGRMGSNAFNEFWPDAKRKFFHRAPQRLDLP